MHLQGASQKTWHRWALEQHLDAFAGSFTEDGGRGVLEACPSILRFTGDEETSVRKTVEIWNRSSKPVRFYVIPPSNPNFKVGATHTPYCQEPGMRRGLWDI
jgi:hypothetical protein